MHEFSLATNIVEIVTDNAMQAQKTIVTEIELVIGELSGVEEPALQTALDSLMSGTMLNNAVVKIKRTHGEAICEECQNRFNLNDLFTLCPKCNGYAKKIISGKEFDIQSITAE